MSCYLNIYLVPKSEEGQESKPIFLTQYSRNTDIYSAITENMVVPYVMDKDVYADLTPSIMQEVKHDVEKSISTMKNRTDTLYKMLEKNYNEDLKDDIVQSEDFIKELQEQLKVVENIEYIVGEVNSDWSDFEKVVVNQG